MSNKFNSNRTLNKTPGVCHSPRKEPAAPTDPPPPGTPPGILYCNCKMIVDLGAGFETFIGTNLTVIETGFGFNWSNTFILTPTRQVSVNFVWSPLIDRFQCRLSASTVPPPPNEVSLKNLFFNEFPGPLILNNIQGSTSPVIQLGVWDVWT